MADKQFGGLWRRLFAYFIDRFILYLFFMALLLVGLFALEIDAGAVEQLFFSGLLPDGAASFALAYILAIIFSDMAYFTWFHGAAGRTPGKMLFGLRVVQASGEPLTFGTAFLRWVGYLISGLPFCLGFLWIAFDRRKQGWHDKLAVTIVVRSGYEPGCSVPVPASETGRAALTPPADHAGGPPTGA